MGARQREWARRVRDQIFDALGRVCKDCGATEAKGATLTFDVKVPTATGSHDGNGHHTRMDWSWRMSFYRRELDNQNLQVLCDKCNTRKGNDAPRVVVGVKIASPF